METAASNPATNIDRKAAEGATARRGRGRPPLDTVKRREHILDRAKDLFLSRGFTNTSVDAIGSAAGVTKRTIYELIGDKEAVFRTVCADSNARHSTLLRDLSIGGLSVREALRALAHMLLDYALDPDTLALTRIITTERTLFPDLSRQILETSQTRLRASLLGLFGELIKDGRLPPLDTEQAIEVFYDAVIGNRGFRAMIGYEEVPVTDAELQDRITMYLEGYANRR